MDSLSALALATEPPHQKLLHRKPVKFSDSLISLEMVKNIIGQIIYQIAALLLILFVLPDISAFLLGDAIEPQTDNEAGE